MEKHAVVTISGRMTSRKFGKHEYARLTFKNSEMPFTGVIERVGVNRTRRPHGTVRDEAEEIILKLFKRMTMVRSEVINSALKDALGQHLSAAYIGGLKRKMGFVSTKNMDNGQWYWVREEVWREVLK